jgi:hypothetical protein
LISDDVEIPEGEDMTEMVKFVGEQVGEQIKDMDCSGDKLSVKNIEFNDDSVVVKLRKE